MNNLKRVPPHTTIEAHLSDLKDRPSAEASFMSAMTYPKRQVEDRLRNLTLDGRPVEVMEYPTKEQCAPITDALKAFDPDFDENYKSWSQMNKMPLLQEVFACPLHCRRTDYSLEFRLCGVLNCAICGRIGRSVRTLDVVVNGMNMREEILRFNSLPIDDPADKDHYMSPAAAREYIVSNNLTLDDMKKFIPGAKLDRNAEQLKKRREKDSRHNFHPSKVRGIAECGSCRASRCIYSNTLLGKVGGPTEEQLERLESSLDIIGFRCGDKISKFDG